MKKNLIFLIATLTVFNSFCQKISIKMKEGDTNTKQKLSNEFTEKSSSTFSYTYSSANLLSFDTDVSKVFKIEGMASKYAGKGKVKLQIENEILGLDTTLVFTTNLSVTNKFEIEDKLIDAFASNPEGIKFFAKEANSYLQKATSKNCKAVIEAANKELVSKNLREAFVKANSMLNSDCRKEAQAVIDRLEEICGEEFCNEKLSKIKILASSGIEYKMEMAVDELYRMPSKAKCKEEAINVSKQIGEYLLKQNNGNSKALNLNQFVLKGSGLEVLLKE